MFFILILFLFFANNFQNIESNNFKTNTLQEVDKNDSKLLIILVDGFRWDYVSRDETLKGFPRIAKNGVHAKYVKPIFPTNSYPNWYAITTGLYAESHGIVANHMYDKRTNEFFLMGPDANVSHPHWWNQTEPLWISAEKQGVKTSMYLWDGCQVPFNGVKASFCYQNMGYFWVLDFESANKITTNNYKKILDDFTENKYRLSFLYHELVDYMGHNFGPSSENVKKAVKQIDTILNDLFNEIIERKLDKTLNVVIVSDHGMTDIKGFKKVFLNKSVDFDNIELMLEWDSGSQILPKPGKENEVYNQLTKVEGIKVYRKDEMPEKFHYKNNPMIFPIYVTADIGYNIEPPKLIKGKVRPFPNEDHDYSAPLTGGNHGYDREWNQMHAIMYGFGPSFKRNYTSEPIEMMDHYNLFCHLLGITPHQNNGTFSRVKHFLKQSK